SGREDPVGPGTGTFRVLRGGDWNGPKKYSRSAHRVGWGAPAHPGATFGIRVVVAGNLKAKPARPPEVPRRAADVLPFLAGNWKVEKLEVEPKPPADQVRSAGSMTCDYVADGKFLRQRGVFATGTVEPGLQAPLKAG